MPTLCFVISFVNFSLQLGTGGYTGGYLGVAHHIRLFLCQGSQQVFRGTECITSSAPALSVESKQLYPPASPWFCVCMFGHQDQPLSPPCLNSYHLIRQLNSPDDLQFAAAFVSWEFTFTSA